MSTRAVVSAVGTLVGGAAVAGIFGLVLHSLPTQPPLIAASAAGMVSTPNGSLPSATLDLSAYADSAQITWRSSNAGQGAHPDWVSYGPSTNLQVPAHSVIIVTIKQYDTGGAMPNPFLATVSGTVGGSMTVDGVASKSIDASNIGHTFTIHSFPTSTQDNLFVSVPLPATEEGAPNVGDTNLPAPHVVKFEFITGGPGTYAWNCEFPCGWYQTDIGTSGGMGGPMSTYGYMSGTLHVV